ncbi:MAG: molybdopterin molybdotransferase MoeA, partial [Thaumarchaeota archaeon]|nr:molybdopterin molybdotransferase MoeA [Nitrososphaerota archaeon]
AVVPVEKARRIGGFVEVYDQVHPNQNVSKRGEDYSRGDLVLGRGWIIKPWHIGALASLGITVVKVLRKPRAVIISTGRELVELGSPLEPGRVYNSTKPMLKALLKAYGVESLDFGILEDDEEAISERIREGLRAADLVIVTGGTSVGALDLVPEAVSKLCDLMIHGFAIRPGKPTGFAISHGKPIFMLSGFPVAALIGFMILVPPALEEMLGCRFDPPPRIRGRLLRRVASPPGIRSYIRVRVYREKSGEVLVEPLRTTGSGILSTLTRGNGLLTIPEEVEGYDEGDEVEVELLSPIYEGGAA